MDNKDKRMYSAPAPVPLSESHLGTFPASSRISKQPDLTLKKTGSTAVLTIGNQTLQVINAELVHALKRETETHHKAIRALEETVVQLKNGNKLLLAALKKIESTLIKIQGEQDEARIRHRH